MEYTITSDNIMHALIMKRKMEINKYVKIIKLIDTEEYKAKMAVERAKISFLQAKQKRRKEWWRMDNHYRESVRKELEASNIKIKNPSSRNETSISSTNSVLSNKYSEFSLPLINTNDTEIYQKRHSNFSDVENNDYPSTNNFSNISLNEKPQLKKTPITPLTPHNTPSINLILKPSKSLLLQPITQVTQISLTEIQNKNEPKLAINLLNNSNDNDKNENNNDSIIKKSADEKQNSKRPLSVHLVKMIAKRKSTTVNEILPIKKEDENLNIQEMSEKSMFTSFNEFPDINSHKENNEPLIFNSRINNEKSSKISDLKRNNAKKIMKTTILNNKKQEKIEDSDDYQSTVCRFLYRTPFHVETSNKLNKLEAETNSIKRQISKQKSLSLTRDNRYNNLLKSLNEKID